MEKQRRRTSTLTTSSKLRTSLTRKATMRPPTLLTVLPPVSPWKVAMRADLPALLPPTTPTRHSTDMFLLTSSLSQTEQSFPCALKSSSSTADPEQTGATSAALSTTELVGATHNCLIQRTVDVQLPYTKNSRPTTTLYKE